ncbi:MAG: AAA family ATPase [Deltaproteobacteria bacterium]|nr:AAA family ATPase [Deltaproteobacteria bacterium]
MTPKAFTVLRHLMERPGQLVTKEDLLDAAWPGVYVSDAALKVCIRRLRQALGDLSRPSRYIETVHWRGYRLLARIATITSSVAEELSAETILRPLAPMETASAPEGRSPLAPVAGREVELQQLSHCLARVAQGYRQTLFITGPPGIGKTTLIDAFLAQAAQSQSLRVARSQCVEHYGTGESYLPLLEALTRLCRAPGGEQAIAALQQHAPVWLAQLPSLLEPAERKRLRREVQSLSREHMIRELVEALEFLAADIPLLLVLEDLHWSDYPTLDLLALLARRREPARLFIIAEYRPEELPQQEHPLKNLKHDVYAHRQGEELAIAPLSLEAISAYLAVRFLEHALPAPLAAILHRQTGGHPLFLATMVDHLVARGWIVNQHTWELNRALDDLQTEVPSNIRQIIAAQIDRLAPEQQRILEVASVAGVEFSAAAVAAAAEEDIVQVETCCEELARRGQFLRTQGTGEWPDGTVATRYEFLHAMYRQAWYERVTAGRRVQLHRRLGERGELAYGERSTEIAAELAVHFEHGRDQQRATQYRQAAAENAARR